MSVQQSPGVVSGTMPSELTLALRSTTTTRAVQAVQALLRRDKAPVTGRAAASDPDVSARLQWAGVGWRSGIDDKSSRRRPRLGLTAASKPRVRAKAETAAAA